MTARPPRALVCGAALKGFATVNKLLPPTPAPIEIATRLEGRRLVGGEVGWRLMAIVGAVPVQN